jgi:uncharacterized protein (DUF2147 family)
MTLLVAAALFAATSHSDPVLGRWRTETRGGIVEIAPCGASVCGTLVSSEGLRANPALTDAHNRDPKLRSRPLRNLQLLGGFTRSGSMWTGGSIYNAEDGKTYSAKLTPEGDRLKVRGCVFVPLCKTQTWTRIR